MRLGRGAIADLGLGSVDPDEVGIEQRAVGGDEPHRDRPVLAGREASDLPLALHDEAHGDRLDSPGREARAHLAREERAQRVSHQAIDDPARLLRVDEVLVDLPRMGEGMQDGGLGDLAEGDPGELLRRKRCRLRHVPGNRLALAVEVGGQEDPVRVPGRPLDGVDVLPRSLVRDHVLGREVVLHVHPELALPGVLGQVADVAVGGEHGVVRPEIAFDRPRLRGRLDDDEVATHGAGSLAPGSRDPALGSRAGSGSRARRADAGPRDGRAAGGPVGAWDIRNPTMVTGGPPPAAGIR